MEYVPMLISGIYRGDAQALNLCPTIRTTTRIIWCTVAITSLQVVAARPDASDGHTLMDRLVQWVGFVSSRWRRRGAANEAARKIIFHIYILLFTVRYTTRTNRADQNEVPQNQPTQGTRHP